MVIVGVLIIGFNVVIPPPVGLAMEFAVALMLIGLGILNLTGGLQRMTERLTPRRRCTIPRPPRTRQRRRAACPRPRATCTGTDPTSAWRRRRRGLGRFQLIRPVVVGLVHGLAGSAAVALLVLATIEDPGTAMAYLLIFCIGVAAGMAS